MTDFPNSIYKEPMKLLVIVPRMKNDMIKEVLRWLRKGKDIGKAINKANKKYPKEALSVDESNINDVASHYDYLLEHENIIRKISH